MDRFLEKFNLPRVNQEEIEIMNNPITSTDTKAEIKNPPKKQKSGPDGFTGEFYQTFTEELMPILLKLFLKIPEEGTVPTHSMRPPSPDTKTRQRKHKKENYRPISLMNIDVKILNKILLILRIQQHIKNMIKFGLFQGCKDSSIYENHSSDTLY